MSEFFGGGEVIGSLVFVAIISAIIYIFIIVRFKKDDTDKNLSKHLADRFPTNSSTKLTKDQAILNLVRIVEDNLFCFLNIMYRRKYRNSSKPLATAIVDKIFCNPTNDIKDKIYQDNNEYLILGEIDKLKNSEMVRIIGDTGYYKAIALIDEFDNNGDDKGEQILLNLLHLGFIEENSDAPLFEDFMCKVEEFATMVVDYIKELSKEGE